MKKHPHKRAANEAAPGYRCRGRIWIEEGGETFIGYGRVVLLERIGEHGSITKAARSMDMSYKHAWDLVDSMNRHAREALVTTSKGGKGGGGATLTDAGSRVINQFRRLGQRLEAFLAAETAGLVL
jgi:molybdate transport system regulatory protein